MNREKINPLKDFEILELPPEATLSEVRKAYRFLRELYSTESIASLPVSSEMSDRERSDIIDEIDGAYGRILQFFGENRPGRIQPATGASRTADTEQILSGIETFGGRELRQVREALRISIHDIARETRVPAHHLENIEAERFEALPPPVYTRGFVVSLADILSLDPARVSSDYMEKYRAWSSARSGKTSRHAFLHGRSRGK